jgi:hypothetical protein
LSGWRGGGVDCGGNLAAGRKGEAVQVHRVASNG